MSQNKVRFDYNNTFETVVNGPIGGVETWFLSELKPICLIFGALTKSLEHLQIQPTHLKMVLSADICRYLIPILK